MTRTVYPSPIDWAFAAPIKNTSMKLVLVALEQYADDRWQTHPAPVRLENLCSMTPVTVRRNIQALIKAGYLADTGEYRYPDGTNRVYQLVGDK